MKLNILLFSHTFLPKIGGRELVVYYLAKSLQELGHKVRIFGPPRRANNSTLDLGVEIHRYHRLIRKRYLENSKWVPLRELEVYFHLMYDICFWKCDIIHAHTTYPAGYISARAKKILKNCGLVITPHGIDIHTIPELGHGMRLNQKVASKINYALDRADAITSISDGIRASLMEAGANKDKIFNVPNGVDIERFKSVCEMPLSKFLHLSSDARAIVTVGNYHPRKGQEVIVKAMPSILASVPDAKLIIVGRGTDALRPLIQQLELDHVVLLTGSIEFPTTTFKKDTDIVEDKLASVLKNSDVFVSAGTQEGSEGLSLAVLEAMAAGLPVIATNISGNKDIIKHGINGFLVEPSNEKSLSKKIIEVLLNKKLRMRMSNEAFSVANQYSWLQVANNYVKVYEYVEKINRQI